MCIKRVYTWNVQIKKTTRVCIILVHTWNVPIKNKIRVCIIRVHIQLTYVQYIGQRIKSEGYKRFKSDIITCCAA